MVSILAVSLVAQVSPMAVEAARGDLAFVRGVEEFVIAADPARRPPEPYRGLIERLGDRVVARARGRLRGTSGGGGRGPSLAVLGPSPPRPRGSTPLERDPTAAESLLHLQGCRQLEELGTLAVLGLPGHSHGVAVVDVGLTMSVASERDEHEQA